MDQLVEKYIQLRDAKAALNNRHKEKVARLDNVLDKIEAALLVEFQKAGIESVKTASGTAYKTTRASATVGDWDTTLEFIRTQEVWNMLERRVSKDAVVQYKEEHGDLPPGVNWREEVTVNVRRSN